MLRNFAALIPLVIRTEKQLGKMKMQRLTLANTGYHHCVFVLIAIDLDPQELPAGADA